MLQAGKVGQHRFSLLGKSICSHAWRRLLGIGSGRFWKLSRAARLQLPVPVDGRFVTRRFGAKVLHQNRVLVAEFLQEIYNTIAEPLPERHGGEDDSVNRGTGSKNENNDRRPRPRLCFRKHRGRRPKVVAQAGRKKDKTDLRMLPPGTYSDYLNLLKTRHPDRRVSLKLFCNVAGRFETSFVHLH